MCKKSKHSFATSRLWGDLRVTSNEPSSPTKSSSISFLVQRCTNLAKVECLAALCLLMEIFWSLEDANAIANMHSCHQMLCNWHSDTPTKHTEVRFDESCGPMSCHASARNQNRPETAKVSQSPLPQICSSRCFVMWLLLRTTEAPTLFFSSSNQHEARVQTITNENKWKQMARHRRNKWKEGPDS